MKKISQHLLAAAVVAAAGVSASAEVLTPEQALGLALPQARMAAPGLVAQPVLAYTEEADELPAVYVFAKENKGFMVVAADDIATPLLGYCDNGNFDADNMAPALKYWLGEYARQIAYGRENGISKAEYAGSRAGHTAIEPMVTTQWGQDSPYNLLVPTIDGRHAPTGCVATAAAQVMKYFEWPAEHGTGGKFSYAASVGNSTQQLEVNIDETILHWDLMLDTYDKNATDQQKDAVAALMQLIGYGVDMSYAMAGSGAQTIKVAKILAENFGYDKGVRYLDRACYTQADWEEMLYNNLANVGPVLYDGSTINNEGHAFVFDGYKEEDGEVYFHVNWGWDGQSDGWFAVGALDPYAQGTGGASSGEGFNYGQNATFGIQPDKGGEATPVFYGAGNGLTISPATNFNLGETVTVGMSGGGFYSASWFTLENPYFGLHIVGNGQDFYRWTSSAPLETIATNYGVASYTLRLDGVKSNATYVLTPVYRIGDKIYNMEMPYGKTRSYTLKTSTHNGELIPNSAVIDLVDMVVPEGVLPLKPGEFGGTFQNNTDTYYYGHAAACILEKEYGEYSIFDTRDNFTVSVAPGESMEWLQKFSLLTRDGYVKGNYYYFAFVDPNNSKMLNTPVKFYYGALSGIDDVEVADENDAPAEYFNLQGIRVDQPQAGQVYIVRRGAKASKELVK